MVNYSTKLIWVKTGVFRLARLALCPWQNNWGWKRPLENPLCSLSPDSLQDSHLTPSLGNLRLDTASQKSSSWGTANSPGCKRRCISLELLVISSLPNAAWEAAGCLCQKGCLCYWLIVSLVSTWTPKFHPAMLLSTQEDPRLCWYIGLFFPPLCRISASSSGVLS